MKRKTLIELFPEWASGGGIFSALDDLDVPWKTEDIADALDLEYYGNLSGDKFASPLVNKILTNGELTAEDVTLLANTIFALNSLNWSKEWATLSAEYNPIENYSMTETMTNDETVIEYGKTHTRTDDTLATRTPDLEEVTTPDLTEETTPDLTTENDNSVYGFNSSNPVPTGEQVTTNTGTSTKTTTGTSTVEKTGFETVANTGTVTDVDTGDDTHTRNYELTRTGNIGVTTSQQMLESERNLWLWNFFRTIVFPDVDRVLTLRIY